MSGGWLVGPAGNMNLTSGLGGNIIHSCGHQCSALSGDFHQNLISLECLHIITNSHDGETKERDLNHLINYEPL